MRLLALSDLTDKGEEFLTEPPRVPRVWTPKNQYIRRIFSLKELDELIIVGGLNAKALTIANFSRRAPESQFTMHRHGVEPAVESLCDPLAIAQFLQQGYSLHLSNVQRYCKAILAFTDRLSFELGAPVKADIFMTPPGAQAFAEHYDINDNFICQVTGTKVWRLYTPSFVDPLPRHPWQWAHITEEIRERVTNSPPDIEVVLRPGSVLWIPRGWIHAGTATDDTSLHITLRPEPISLEWVSQRMVESLSDMKRNLRRSVAYRSLFTPQAATDTLIDTIKCLSSLLSDVDVKASGLDLWRSHGNLFDGPVLRPVADVCVDEEADPTVLWARPEGAVGYWRANDTLHLHLGTARKILTGKKADFVEWLLNAGDHTRVDHVVKNFAPGIDWVEFVRELKAIGLIVRGSDLPSHWLSEPSGCQAKVQMSHYQVG